MKEKKRRLSGLREEEARLGRLYITGKIGKKTYEQLRKEWQIKLRKIEINISDTERISRIPLDDFYSGLLLIANISSLYAHLKESDRAKILQIIAKRIIVILEGEIIDHVLHSPFVYLRRLIDEFQIKRIEPRGSEQLRSGMPCEKIPLRNKALMI